MRHTSLEVYEKVKASGLLSRMRMLVFEILCRHSYVYNSEAGLTANEMQHAAELVYHAKNGRHLHKRLSELERMGMVKTTGTRQCRRTGNTSLIWSITGNLVGTPIPSGTKFMDRRAIGAEENKTIAIEKLRILYHEKDRTDAQWKEVANSIKAI